MQRKQLPKPWLTPCKGHAGPGGNQTWGDDDGAMHCWGMMLCPTFLSGKGNKGAIMLRQRKKEDK